MSAALEEAGQGNQKRKLGCFHPRNAAGRESKRSTKSIRTEFKIRTGRLTLGHIAASPYLNQRGQTFSLTGYWGRNTSMTSTPCPKSWYRRHEESFMRCGRLHLGNVGLLS